MNIQIKWQDTELGEGDFFAESIDEAIEYLQEIQENADEEDEELTLADRYNSNAPKFGLSFSDIEYKEALEYYLSVGYQITYTGKYGVTLELTKEN